MDFENLREARELVREFEHKKELLEAIYGCRFSDADVLVVDSVRLLDMAAAKIKGLKEELIRCANQQP